MRRAFAGSRGMAGLPDSLPGLMAGLVAEYRVHHLVEGLPGVNGNRPECAQAVLISRQEAAYVLARVPGTAPLVVLARIQFIIPTHREYLSLPVCCARAVVSRRIHRGGSAHASEAAHPHYDAPLSLGLHDKLSVTEVTPLAVALTDSGPGGSTGSGVASQITVSGRIQHKDMDATILMKRIRKHFPRLEASDYDFTIPLGDCRAQFACENIGNLDFRIVPTASDGASPVTTSSAVTAIEMLVRSTDTLWRGVRKSLATPYLRKHPILEECRIEDTQTKFTLLTRDATSPLRSTGAKVAYLMSVLFFIAAIILVLWQLRMHQSADTRTANILTITLSLGAAALSAPIPILVDWRDWKKTLKWRYARVGQR